MRGGRERKGGTIGGIGVVGGQSALTEAVDELQAVDRQGYPR